MTRARSWRARTLGLIGRTKLGARDGMLFERCAGIHTFFMRVPIDVVFLDAQHRVVRAVRCVPPWRPLVACRGARAVVELAAGTIDRRRIDDGVRLKLTATAQA
ncbi:MAG: DUF192 domain-containing protein [Candidatus Tyrphobacter sp.]